MYQNFLVIVLLPICLCILISVFHRANIFNLYEVPTYDIFFMNYTNDVISKNSTSNSRSPRFNDMLSFINLVLLHWHLGVLYSFSYFMSNMWNMCLDCCFVCECWMSSWSSILCLKDYLFHWIAIAPLQKSNSLYFVVFSLIA